MAKIGFRGFGWIAGIATVLPACYMVTSAVAAERGRVQALEGAIVQARRDIRGLETEFETRANYAQLEDYNGEALQLAAPRPEQFVTGEAALAALRPLGGGIHYASLVVPQGTPVPAAALAAPTAVETAAVTVKAAVGGGLAEGKTQAVAMLDRKLLSDTTLGDIASSARAEAVRMR